jgi:hypothetical protein
MKKCELYLFKLTRGLGNQKIAILILSLFIFCSQTVLAKPFPQANPKSNSKALSYSLVGTLAPIAISIPLLRNGDAAGLFLGSFGLLIGPGMGHLYAGNPNRFLSGMFIRGAVGITAIYSILQIDILDDTGNSGPVMFFLLGSSALLASIIHDIGSTGKSVEQYNQQHGFAQIKIQPGYWANHQAFGLSFGIRF